MLEIIRKNDDNYYIVYPTKFENYNQMDKYKMFFLENNNKNVTIKQREFFKYCNFDVDYDLLFDQISYSLTSSTPTSTKIKRQTVNTRKLISYVKSNISDKKIKENLLKLIKKLK